MAEPRHNAAQSRLPRVTIQFCTQCKWMLRAAYYAQELLSTFSTALGEVALQPATGGIFIVEITAPSQQQQQQQQQQQLQQEGTATPATATSTATDTAQSLTQQQQPQKKTVLWDRKVDGGFPETKELKRRVRDVISPGRDLGHVDREYPRGGQAAGAGNGAAAVAAGGGSGGKGERGGEGLGVGAEEKGEERKEKDAGKVCSVVKEGSGEKCEDCD